MLFATIYNSMPLLLSSMEYFSLQLSFINSKNSLDSKPVCKLDSKAYYIFLVSNSCDKLHKMCIPSLRLKSFFFPFNDLSVITALLFLLKFSAKIYDSMRIFHRIFFSSIITYKFEKLKSLIRKQTKYF